MLRSEDINELAAALSKAQAEMRAAEQDRDNTYFRSRYATLDSVWNACREPLTKNGLAVVQTMEPTGDTALLTVVTTLLHTSGQWISSPLTMPVVKVERKDAQGSGRIDPQAVGSCITYARRYGLAAMVGVAPDEDDDGNAASQGGSQGAKAGPAQAPRQRAVAERVAQASEREGSYAGATGAKAAPKEPADRAKARTAFFGAFSAHFGRVPDEQRHNLVNKLLHARGKVPVANWDGWQAAHFDYARRLVDEHADKCPGGEGCELLHPGGGEPSAEVSFGILGAAHCGAWEELALPVVAVLASWDAVPETLSDWPAESWEWILEALQTHTAGNCTGGEACEIVRVARAMLADQHSAPAMGGGEPTPESAAPTPDTQAPAANGHGAKPGGAAVCSVPTCGKALTKPQMQVSKQQFGRSLCPSCQKEAKAEAAG